MFTFRQKGMVRYLESDLLGACGFLTHAFLTRSAGASEGRFSSLNFSVKEGDAEDRVARNWEILADAFQFPLDRFLMMSQVHGDRIVVAEDLEEGRSAHPSLQCDAVFTARQGTVIGIKTADCVPILLTDRAKGVIGAVHAGWRGTSLHVVGKALGVMMKRFASRPRDILAATGPAIGPCCYQVDEQVFSLMENGSGSDAVFRACEEKGKWMLDLVKANERELLEAGLPRENVVSAGTCTCCRRDLFFSHRGEKGGTGRQLNFIFVNRDR
jgi:hypothetical protein